MRINEGHFDASGLKFSVVVSRFNNIFSSQLLEGALDRLRRHGAREEDLSVTWVPGSFEIPMVARRLTAESDAVICLGAVVRGETPHFDYVAAEVAKGVAHASMDTEVPIIFGVITTDTLEQAIERSGSKAGNKGADAADSAIEMANLMKKL